MNTINLWKDFIQNSNKYQDKDLDNAIILIVLNKSIRPKGAFDFIMLNRKPPSIEEFESLGYVFNSDKTQLLRTGRFYWSKEMKTLADWCEKNNIQYSFDIKGHPFLSDDGTLLELLGDWKKDSFPLKIKHICVTSKIDFS